MGALNFPVQDIPPATRTGLKTLSRGTGMRKLKLRI